MGVFGCKKRISAKKSEKNDTFQLQNTKIKPGVLTSCTIEKDKNGAVAAAAAPWREYVGIEPTREVPSPPHRF